MAAVGSLEQHRQGATVVTDYFGSAFVFRLADWANRGSVDVGILDFHLSVDNASLLVT